MGCRNTGFRRQKKKRASSLTRLLQNLLPNEDKKGGRQAHQLLDITDDGRTRDIVMIFLMV